MAMAIAGFQHVGAPRDCPVKSTVAIPIGVPAMDCPGGCGRILVRIGIRESSFAECDLVPSLHFGVQLCRTHKAWGVPMGKTACLYNLRGGLC